MNDITIEEYIENLTCDYWLFSYGGCGTNYLRKVLRIFNNSRNLNVQRCKNYFNRINFIINNNLNKKNY